MASSSVHFPEDLVTELDRIARERGVSRNRLIVEACRRVIRERNRWTDGFFSNDHLSEEDLLELERSSQEFLDDISAARHSRRSSPL